MSNAIKVLLQDWSYRNVFNSVPNLNATLNITWAWTYNIANFAIIYVSQTHDYWYTCLITDDENALLHDTIPFFQTLDDVRFFIIRTLTTYVDTLEIELLTYVPPHESEYTHVNESDESMIHEYKCIEQYHLFTQDWISDMISRYNAHICTSTKLYSNLIKHA